jgi:hypothetical protein
LEPWGRTKWDEAGEFWKYLADSMPVFTKGFLIDNPVTGNEV